MTAWADDDLVTDVKITPEPRTGQTVSGYGGRIPTRYMIQYAGRWHRVYMMQYGNSGTAYILKGGATLVLETNTEHRIDKVREGVGTPTPVAINKLEPGDRFRFHHDGVVNTLVVIGNMRYHWHDYQGAHYLYPGTYSGTGRTAWPYVYPTTDPETEV